MKNRTLELLCSVKAGGELYLPGGEVEVPAAVFTDDLVAGLVKRGAIARLPKREAPKRGRPPKNAD